MDKRELIPGSVIQINPDHEKFGGMFVVVTEPHEWGCQGYLLHWCDFDAVRFRDKAYVRIKWDGMEYVGVSPWQHVEDESEPE